MTTTIQPATAKAPMRNITLRLSAQILQKAKVLAAQRETSVSGLISQQLEELVQKSDSYEQAKVRALARLRSGFTFGKIEHMTREEMHDRKAAREPIAND